MNRLGTGFELLRPELWWTGLGVLLLVAAGAYGLVRRRSERRRLVHEAQLERFFGGFSAGRAAARVAFAGAAAAFLFASLLGPVLGYTQRRVVRRGLDLVVCVDTSRSMLAEDLRPNRLERALREVRGLFDQLAGDRVSVVAFSGDARDVSPLTHDTSTLTDLLRYVSPDDNRVGGTDLGAAIDHALALFDGRTGAHEAIVLLTDGEDLSGRGREAAREAAERGIRVFVVGVGTRQGGKIRVVGDDGRESFLVGPEGEEVVTRLEDETLRELAESTGGEYLSTEESATPLETLFERRVARLDRRDLEGGVQRVPHDRFQYTLALAFLFMLAEVGLRERRRKLHR